MVQSAALGHALAQHITSSWTAILLPNSVAFATTIFAMWSQSKKILILNYSLSSRALFQTIEELGVRQLVTAKKFIEHQKLQPLIEQLNTIGVKSIYIDEVKIGIKSKLTGIKSLLVMNKTTVPEQPAVALFKLWI